MWRSKRPWGRGLARCKARKSWWRRSSRWESLCRSRGTAMAFNSLDALAMHRRIQRPTRATTRPRRHRPSLWQLIEKKQLAAILDQRRSTGKPARRKTWTSDSRPASLQFAEGSVRSGTRNLGNPGPPGGGRRFTRQRARPQHPPRKPEVPFSQGGGCVGFGGVILFTNR